MPRKVSDTLKKEIIEAFKKGFTIKELSQKFKFSINTITKHLKSNIDEFNILNLKTKSLKTIDEENNELELKSESDFNKDYETSFFEISPLNEHIEFESQKDITSIPISKAVFPNVVYMLVDKTIELDPKFLRDYPEWNFLPENDLQRKTLRIFSDQRVAKKNCQKNQKMIKIPNTKIFALVSDRLISKGISRIILDDSLIAL